MDEELLKRLMYLATTVMVYNDRLIKCLQEVKKGDIKDEKKSKQKIK